MHLFPSAASLLLVLAAGLGASDTSAATGTQAPRRERVEQCNWDRPGHRPFMGEVVAAIDRYSDIPTAVRMRLKQRMQARQYDEMVDIRRDSITGRQTYEPTIRDMHFGLDRVCHQVSRAGWTAQMHERGLVYCEQDHCILIPTVCRNVSRIVRGPSALAGAPGGETPLDTDALPPTSAGPTASSSETFVAPDAPSGPLATSSFAEGVAGAALAIGGGGPGDPALDDPDAPGSADSSGPIVGAPGGVGGGVPGVPFPGGGVGGGGGFGPAPPLAAIPEPSTWASLLAGAVLLGLVSARCARRRRAAAH